MNMSSLRVCMLLDRYLPVIGGTELQASRLATALQARGHSINIVTRRLTVDLPAKETVNGIQVHRLSPVGLSHFANVVIIGRVFLYLVSQRQNYDLIHVHGVGPLGLAALLATKLTHKPVLIKVAAYGNLSRIDHAGIVPNRYTRFVRRILLPPWLWNWWLHQASAIVVLGRETVNEALGLGLGDRTVHIPNGVDTSRFSPLPLPERVALRHRLGIADDERILLFTGRLVRGKGLDTIVEALPELVKKMPHIRLWLAGSGALQSDNVTEELQQAIVQLGLTDKVQFLGAVSQVEQYLQAADLFIFPSRKEGMPNALLEAMACGLPVIASDIDGVRDVAEDEIIRFFPVGDSNTLAKVILDAVSAPEATVVAAERARQHVETAFSLSSVAREYEAVYHALISNENVRSVQNTEHRSRQRQP